MTPGTVRFDMPITINNSEPKLTMTWPVALPEVNTVGSTISTTALKASSTRPAIWKK